VNDEVEPGSDWSSAEIDLVVADYFSMLQDELTGRAVNKAARNRALRELVGRSRGSIEFKHQNISAVLDALDHPWIRGYKPRANFQGALLSAVERRLEAGDLDRLSLPLMAAQPAILFVDPPPFSQKASIRDPALARLVGKFDAAERDARNRSLGRRGEERIFHAEVDRLSTAGRPDLARKVQWTSQEVGDGAGFDIRSFAPDGLERLLEVKTTLGGETVPFFLTENERRVGEERSDVYRIVRLYDFARRPRAFELQPPLDRHLALRPAVYTASFFN
jgi:hypothetical protein